MYFYLNLFFIYAISGYLFETITMSLMHKQYNSSVLYGPWTIVYGMAIIIMIIIFLLVKRLKLSESKEKIVYFFTITIVLTILEGLSGFIIEKTRHVVYWNYDNLPLHIGHYMAFEISTLWGLLSLASMYFIIPRIKEKINRIPKIITNIILFLFIIDMVISFML